MSAPTIEVLFTPADFEALKVRDLSQTACVVFDVLRATSTMVTALANGAHSIVPVSEVLEALEIPKRDPEVLLAGEREGLRIGSELTGGKAFDLGNSPREFTADKVQGRRIVMTTTNGTRALRACAHAANVFIGSFLNLRATAICVEREPDANLLVICSGTFEQTAYEDVLAAGAFCDLIWPRYAGNGQFADSAVIARRIFNVERNDLLSAMSQSRNGQRLLSRPELSADVAFCAQVDTQALVARLDREGVVRRWT